MTILVILISWLFALSLSGILLIFVINPFLIMLVYLFMGKKAILGSPIIPSVSLITIVHNAEEYIVQKLRNSLSLQYPHSKFEIIIFSDGSTDKTEELVRSFEDSRIHFLSSPIHEGKNNAINRCVQNCSGEILIFSDVGALLDLKAIQYLVNSFADVNIGGACGALKITQNNASFSVPQDIYWRLDRMMKELESQSGSISSNTGSLYAIRKDLFQSVPQAATDDLFQCLSVVKQYLRFIFAPEAISYIEARSKSTKHEVRRRRRIVSRSLECIWIMRGVLNFFNYGVFSIRLFINKVLRRLLPVFLILLFFSSFFLTFHYPWIAIVLSLQIVLYLLAISYVFLQNVQGGGIFHKFSSLAYYFLIGNYGTLLGLFDFLRGRQTTRW